jgi:two-component system, NtrC family, sensor kinase
MLSPGYKCQTAETVKTPRHCLETSRFDLLITDILMPEESGLVLIQFVKNHFPNIAVVVVSGVSGQEDIRPILEAGVYGYVVKPFMQEQLLITVENALRRHRLENRQRMDRQLLKQAVEAKTRDLERSHSQTASLVSAITSIIVGLSRDGQVVQWNKAAVTLIADRVDRQLIYKRRGRAGYGFINP